MKTINREEKGVVFQGDIMVAKVAELPKDAKVQENQVVAHSETGHHHIATQANVFAVPDGMTLYMQAIGTHIDLEHKRSYDTHETLRLLTKPGDVFKIRRQREHTPEGWKMVVD